MKRDETLISPDPILVHVMLTVAAIVQAVTFTELIQSCHFKMLHVSWDVHDWLRIAQVIAMFQVIVVVWFGQMVSFVGTELWPKQLFGFLDALFPFAMGAIEVKLVHLLDAPSEWCLWMAAFFWLLLISWSDAYRKLARRRAHGWNKFGPHFDSQWRWNFASSVAFGIAFLLAPLFVDFSSVRSRLILFALMNILTLTFAFQLKQTWNDVKSLPSIDHGRPSPPSEVATHASSTASITGPRLTPMIAFFAVLACIFGLVWPKQSRRHD
jgi:hypothetical protein